MKIKSTLILYYLFSTCCLASERSKNLSFEDELIEGLNRSSLESVQAYTGKRQSFSNTLYKTRQTFTDKKYFLIQDYSQSTEQP